MLATTTVSTYRGTATDSFSDVVDDNTTPAASGVPASLIESSRKVFMPDSSRIETIRYMICRVRPGVDVLAGDRIRDERTSLTYSVTSVHQVASSGYTADKVLNLLRT